MNEKKSCKKGEKSPYAKSASFIGNPPSATHNRLNIPTMTKITIIVK